MSCTALTNVTKQVRVPGLSVDGRVQGDDMVQIDGTALHIAAADGDRGTNSYQQTTP